MMKFKIKDAALKAWRDRVALIFDDADVTVAYGWSNVDRATKILINCDFGEPERYMGEAVIPDIAVDACGSKKVLDKLVCDRVEEAIQGLLKLTCRKELA